MAAVAFDHHPSHGTVMVVMQRQAPPWVHPDALDLMSGAPVEFRNAPHRRSSKSGASARAAEAVAVAVAVKADLTFLL